MYLIDRSLTVDNEAASMLEKFSRRTTVNPATMTAFPVFLLLTLCLASGTLGEHKFWVQILLYVNMLPWVYLLIILPTVY